MKQTKTNKQKTTEIPKTNKNQIAGDPTVSPLYGRRMAGSCGILQDDNRSPGKASEKKILRCVLKAGWVR